MNIIVKARHMDVSHSVREFVEKKMAKLPHFYDNIQQIEVILEVEADKPSVEIIVSATHKNTFVAKDRADDMYAAVDKCLDKIVEQLRRHKDRVRDRQGPSHRETMSLGE